jgi:hypothetical protein
VAAVLVLSPLPSYAQRTFPSAEAAAQAFVDAVARSDGDAMRAILGANYRRYVPVGTLDDEDETRFLAASSQAQRVVPQGEGKAVLEVGRNGWQLPIPIVKTAQGWRFDMAAGADEIRTRRIGRDELAAMQAMLAYYDAQKEYAEKDRNADSIPEYARKLVSSPGKHDGLYWSADGAEESPLGPRFGGDRPGKTYHGYQFKILTRQGPDAPGGAYDYVIGGRMKAGFALVAWPAKYGDTGVMTFIVSHAGAVYQKDLGPGTDPLARRMTEFNPDAGWTKVDVPEHSSDTAQATGGEDSR